MSLILRSVKGSQLTFNEMDGNFTYLEDLDQGKLTTSSFNAFTSSYNTGSFTGSFIGDGSGLTGIPGVTPIETGSFATTGSNVFVGNQIVTGSLTVTGAITGSQVGNIIPFYFNNQAAFPSAATYHGAIAHSHSDGKMYYAHGGVWIELANTTGSFTGSFVGDGSGLTNIPGVTPIETGSFITTSSFNAATGSFATTGSNVFVGNQTITGSLILSSSAAIELRVIGNSVLSGSLTVSGSTIQSGSIDISGSINADGFELDVTSTTNILALNSTFNLDLSGSQSPIIHKTLLLNNGKVLVAGRFESIDGHTTNDIARLNSNGSVDTSFTSTNIGGGYSATSQYINTLVTQSDDKIIIVGSFSSVQDNLRTGIARLSINGTLDSGLSNPGFTTFSEVRDVVIQNDNKIVVVGYFDGGIKRLNTDGTIDASLSVPDSTGFTDNAFYSVALLPSGSDEAILVGGNFTQWNTSADYNYIVKLSPSGSLDAGFAGTNLDVTTGNILDRIKKIKVTDAYSEGDNGYIYIAGRFKDTLSGPNVRHAGFARLTTADEGDGVGAFDSGFRTYISGSDQNLSGLSVYVNDFDFYDGDKILLGGNFITFGVPGYNTTSANRFAIVSQNTGNLISGWSASGSASTYNFNTGSVNSVTLLPNDNVLAGGTFTSASNPSTAREGLASLKLTGFGNITTISDYSITANTNQLLISSSNTDFSGNVNISGSITGSSLLVTGSANINGFMTYPQVSASLNFANDTAAASSGVPLGGIYRSGSFILIRLV